VSEMRARCATYLTSTSVGIGNGNQSILILSI
jgi:hypothetical protein